MEQDGLLSSTTIQVRMDDASDENDALEGCAVPSLSCRQSQHMLVPGTMFKEKGTHTHEVPSSVTQ